MEYRFIEAWDKLKEVYSNRKFLKWASKFYEEIMEAMLEARNNQRSTNHTPDQQDSKDTSRDN